MHRCSPLEGVAYSFAPLLQPATHLSLHFVPRKKRTFIRQIWELSVILGMASQLVLEVVLIFFSLHSHWIKLPRETRTWNCKRLKSVRTKLFKQIKPFLLGESLPIVETFTDRDFHRSKFWIYWSLLECRLSLLILVFRINRNRLTKFHAHYNILKWQSRFLIKWEGGIL